ncbi:MAG: redox-sensing transcriptional repressor Rex [Bacillota bacterium]
MPEPTLRRLPVYLHYLKELQEAGKFDVSTTHIAGELKLDPTQVRKDLAYTGIIGKPKVGYDVGILIKSIEDFLNWNNLTDAFLVGAGNLGLAIIGYEGIKKYGINIVAAFDNAPEKTGKEFYDISILPVEKLHDLAQRMHIHIGILTVPASQAQKTAESMVQAGIKAIWNFAPVNLKLPEDVIVENAGFTTSLAVLTRKLSEKLK